MVHTRFRKLAVSYNCVHDLLVSICVSEREAVRVRVGCSYPFCLLMSELFATKEARRHHGEQA